MDFEYYAKYCVMNRYCELQNGKSILFDSFIPSIVSKIEHCPVIYIDFSENIDDEFDFGHVITSPQQLILFLQKPSVFTSIENGRAVFVNLCHNYI